jgi:hypothetical protein
LLDKWLAWSLRTPRPHPSFDVVDITESSERTPEIITGVASILQDCLVDPAFLLAASEWLRWPQLQEWRRDSAPRGIKLRRGAFGEALTTAMMELFHGHLVPVRKLHYTITRGQSLPGTDVIAITSDDHQTVTGVCFIETKLRTTTAFASQAVTEAVLQLRRDHDEALPSMLKFVAEHLHTSNHSLFSGFMRYMKDRRDLSHLDSFRIFLTWDSSA